MAVVVAMVAGGVAGCGDSNDSGSCSGSGCEPHIESATDGGEAGASGAGVPSDVAGSGGTTSEEAPSDAGSGGDATGPEPSGAAGAPNQAEPCDEPGALRCEGAAETGYFECVDGGWQAGECERGALCDNETGECAPVIVDCAPREPGDAYCDGSTRAVCGADLVSVERETCEFGCADGECVSAVCGDGTVQAPEQCDDGNDLATDACLPSCVRARCGDSLVHEGEEACDDGNRDDTDACTTTCAEPICGDGLVWKGFEFCDDGNDDDADGCPSNCQEPRCGDGYLVRGVEGCDDSNAAPGDGCSSDCRVEVSAFSLGNDHSCAVLHDGRLKCWGSNEKGQLGFGSLGDVIGDSTSELGAELPAVLEGPITQVAAGGAFTCALVEEQLWCWGDNEHGQLGRESATAASVEPAVADLGGAVRSVCAGKNHACAIVEGGDVKCWGANDLGQSGAASAADIGDQSGEMGSDLSPVSLEKPATVVGCGDSFTCAIVNDGDVYCWGNANYGQVGPTDGLFTSEPNLIPLGTIFGGAAELALGGNHVCAVAVDREARCWGNGTYGQRASGDTANVGRTAVEIEELPPAEFGAGLVAAVAAGSTSTCAVLRDGTARCFGENALGVLAKSGRYSEQSGNPGHLGDDETFVRPLQFSAGDVEVRAIDVGAHHACALLDNGSLACWGDNSKGQLGIGTTQAPSDVISDDVGELPREAVVE